MKPTKKKVEVVKEGKTYKPKPEQGTDFDKAAFKKNLKELNAHITRIDSKIDKLSLRLEKFADITRRAAGRMGIE